uniref:Uncharacterized protein n=1 Tax=Heterorhabditis bacteriophora TaxID=37862 RepID=A0A1I7XU46_HETBA
MKLLRYRCIEEYVDDENKVIETGSSIDPVIDEFAVTPKLPQIKLPLTPVVTYDDYIERSINRVQKRHFAQSLDNLPQVIPASSSQSISFSPIQLIDQIPAPSQKFVERARYSSPIPVNKPKEIMEAMLSNGEEFNVSDSDGWHSCWTDVHNFLTCHFGGGSAMLEAIRMNNGDNRCAKFTFQLDNDVLYAIRTTWSRLNNNNVDIVNDPRLLLTSFR